MAKCVYCAKQTDAPCAVFTGKGRSAESFSCCSETCKRKAGRYFRYVRHFTWLFFLMLLGSLTLFLAVGLEFTSDVRFAAAGVALLGLCCLMFPFPTGGMVERWGVKRSALVVRLLGGGVFLAGTIWMLCIWN